MTSKKSSKKAYTALEALVLLHSLDEVESDGGAASESDVSWCLEEASSSSESDTDITSQMPLCKKKRLLETLNSTLPEIPSAKVWGLQEDLLFKLLSLFLGYCLL